MSKSRAELRAQNVRLIGDWLATYVLDGHRLSFETRCGDDPEDNVISFRISDWSAFAEIMDSLRRRSA